MADSSASGLGVDAADIVGQLSGRPEDYGNSQDVEIAWAMKAHEHARIHMNILCSMDVQNLKLTNSDDAIYDAFRQKFGDDFPLEDTPESVLKTPEYKQKWREFAETFTAVQDYNFGTLLRHRADDVYSPTNTILVTRIQFLAIEIARNRHGVNTKYQKQLQLLQNNDS